MADTWKIRVPGNVGPPPVQRHESVPYPTCEHSRVDIRRKRQVNGVLVAVKQCLGCGRNCGAVKKSEAGNVETLPEWDEAFRERRQQEISAEWQRRHDEARAAGDAEWWAWYESYLVSPQWLAKRTAVLKRDNHVCQGCGSPGASQVHHLTYVRVGREMLFDLVAVCARCHEAIHADKRGVA